MTPPPLADEQVRALRARAQHLDRRLGDAAELVRELVGVQAQEAGAGGLSIGVRTNGVDAAAVERALTSERSLVRTWTMRGTIHIVPTEDAAWLTELFAPPSLAGSQRRLAQLGVPEGDWPRATAVIQRALAENGPLTRAALMDHVARVGVATTGQAAAHLVRLTALQGLVVYGPPHGAKPTYVLREDWLGPSGRTMPRDQALAELARRYVRASGPAAPEDLAAWSGLPLRDARAGWEGIAKELAEVGISGGGAWIAADRLAWLDERGPDGPPALRLLPAFDTYLLSYRTRSLAVPPAHERQVWPGGGIVRPAAVAGGLALGTWRQRRGSARVTVAIEPFPDTAIRERAVADELAHLGRFLGVEAVREG